MAPTDKILTCRDCGKEFPFSAGEQDFYISHQLNDPRRCPECRANRRKENGANGVTSENPRPSYPAICAGCGAETTIPFQPVEDRPVYCRECFAKVRTPRKDSY